MVAVEQRVCGCMCSYEGGAGGSGRASAAAGSANPLPDFAGAGARAVHAIDANVGDFFLKVKNETPQGTTQYTQWSHTQSTSVQA